MSSRAPAHTDDGSTTSFESLSQAVHQQIQYYDAQKNALIEGVLQRYAFEAQQMAHERQSIRVEREALRKAKQEADVYKNNLSVLQSLTNRDAFALVLIDGNGILFRDQYLQDSSEGGQRAAKDIQAEVLSHLISHVAETPPDVKVVVRIYADFCHLNVMYRQARSSNGHDMLRAITEFAAAFTEGSALCDFIHVKRRGGCISAKIAGLYKAHLHDVHCRQVYLGCEPDSCYDAMLNASMNDEVRSKVTLLAPTQLDQGLVDLHLKCASFTTIFRSTAIVVTESVYARSLSAMSRLGFTPSTSSTSSDTSSSIQRHPSTWASMASASAPHPGTSIPIGGTPIEKQKPTQKEQLEPEVRRNRKGQRLDPALLPFKKDVVEKVKTMKLCNMHYLRGECTNNKCPHEHDIKLTKQQLNSLPHVARMTFCNNGSACSDVYCYHGHHCPFPKDADGGRGGKGCINGTGCRFPTDTHIMDMVAIETTAI